MLKQSFAFFPLLYWGIKVYGKLNGGLNFGIDWNSLHVLFYVSVLLFSLVSSFSLLIFLISMALSCLVSGILVEAGT